MRAMERIIDISTDCIGKTRAVNKWLERIAQAGIPELDLFV
jgi:hypothetical protein